MSRSKIPCTILVAVASACADTSSDAPNKAADTGATTTDTGTDNTGTDDTGTDDTGPAPVGEAAATLSGSFILTIDTSRAYESEYPDCSFSFTYEGTRTLEMPWYCPACDLYFNGIATLVEGEDCQATYAALDDAATSPSWPQDFGISLDDGGVWMPLQWERVHRYWQATLTFTEETEITLDAPVSVPSNDYPGAANYELGGTLRYDLDADTVLPDPLAPRDGAPYACGWPQNNPGTLELDYALAVGQTFPNLRLRDQCGEEVDVWDFYGSWLIIDSTQPDCGPCQVMADSAEAWLSERRAAGYDIHIISLLGSGLNDPTGTPSDAVVQDWVETFGVTGPVLADKGAGFAMFSVFLELLTGIDGGFPATIVVNPEMQVVDGQNGFSDWSDFTRMIERAERL